MFQNSLGTPDTNLRGLSTLMARKVLKSTSGATGSCVMMLPNTRQSILSSTSCQLAATKSVLAQYLDRTRHRIRRRKRGEILFVEKKFAIVFDYFILVNLKSSLEMRQDEMLLYNAGLFFRNTQRHICKILRKHNPDYIKYDK